MFLLLVISMLIANTRRDSLLGAAYALACAV